jgi:acyl-CoA oxidase
MSFFMKDYKKYFYMAELLALVDLSLVSMSTSMQHVHHYYGTRVIDACFRCVQTVKMGVQYSLWGGSVMNLGTERHKKQYFDAIDKFQIPGDSHTTHEYKTFSTITQVQT